ncbi:hypothetical protein ES703_104031 [subsurface metagenome]
MVPDRLAGFPLLTPVYSAGKVLALFAAEQPMSISGVTKVLLTITLLLLAFKVLSSKSTPVFCL